MFNKNNLLINNDFEIEVQNYLVLLDARASILTLGSFVSPIMMMPSKFETKENI